MVETNITFTLDGPKLKEAVPLLDVLVSLQEFHYIIDKAYLSTTKSKRISSNDRKYYSIIATDFKKGSFITELQLFAVATVQTLPNIPGATYKDIWTVAKGSYDFLKALAEKRSGGVEPIINITGNVNAPIIIGNQITISETVFNSADRSEPNFKKITSVIKPGEIDLISSFDSDGVGFELTEKDKNLFNPKTTLDKEVFTIECDIYKYDKISRAGRMQVFERQSIPPREYPFKPVRSSDSYLFIQAMAKRSVKVNVMKEIEIHTTGVERIAALRVVSIDDFKMPGLFD
jgi:hypothetical protein